MSTDPPGPRSSLPTGQRSHKRGRVSGPHSQPTDQSSRLESTTTVDGSESPAQLSASSDSLLHAVLNALPEHIAVLDARGIIVAVNQPWPYIRAADEGSNALIVGKSFLELFRQNIFESDQLAETAFQQLSDLIAGRIESCALDYSCEQLGKSRWFQLNGRRANHEQAGFVISQLDVTDRKQAEAKLRESEAFARRVSDIAPCVLYIYDLDERCNVWGNFGMFKVLGYSREQLDAMCGSLLSALMHTDDFAAYAGYAARLMELPDGETAEFEYRLKAADGTWRFLYSQDMVFRRSRDGRVTQIIGAALDITHRKQAEQALRESENRFRSMADGLPLIVWVHDAQGNQEFVNATFCEFFGVTREQMRDGRWQMLLHPDDAETYIAHFARCVRERSYFNAEVRVRDAQGRWRWLESWAQPRWSESQEFLGFIGTSADVTERKLGEEALAERLVLEQKINEQSRQIASESQRKDEFLATLAHELRNPLATIGSGLEVLKLQQSNNGAVRETHELMQRQFNHLVALVDDLLDMSRISQGKLNLRREVVVLADAIESAIETCHGRISEAKHQLLIHLPPRDVKVFGDSHRLQQTFANLLGNAAKFTPAGGRIEIDFRLQDGNVEVDVKDTGIGIPLDKLSLVFNMFAQIQNDHSAGYAGLGIGLALVKSLVGLHGGSIRVSSPGINHGSTFSVCLPTTALENCVASAMNHASAPASTSKRVLVVDDNVGAAKLLSVLIASQGHNVRVAYDGHQALNVGEAFRPEIIFMDLGLPVMNGYQAAKAIRQEHWGKQTVLVALTGWGQAEDKRKSTEAGFDQHLVKPVSNEALHVILSS